MYGGIFKNPDGTAFLSGDVPHLYRVWSGAQAVAYANISVAPVNKAGITLGAGYNITKWRAFLPSNTDAGEPVLASIRVPSNGFHAIDGISPATGGWFVYGISTGNVSVVQNSAAPYSYYYQGYTRKNQCGYIYNRGMQSTSSATGVVNYVINGANASSLPVVDGYALYSSAMGAGYNEGIILVNTAGERVFQYPAKYNPIKARVDTGQIPAPSMISSNDVRALNNTNGLSVSFYGVGQYVIDRAFYLHNTICSYGCDGYSGCVNEYRTDGTTIVLRNMIDSNGIVRRIPVKTSMYSSSSYTDNSSVVGFGGSPVSSSGSTSSGYKISTSVSNTDGEYAIAIPV